MVDQDMSDIVSTSGRITGDVPGASRSCPGKARSCNIGGQENVCGVAITDREIGYRVGYVRRWINRNHEILRQSNAPIGSRGDLIGNPFISITGVGQCLSNLISIPVNIPGDVS